MSHAENQAWWGLDVGGANIKLYAPGVGARSQPFELWKRPRDLADMLGVMLGQAPDRANIAATMTGELADCYRSKAEGVAAICDALVAAANGRGLRVYTTDGRFLDAAEAHRAWPRVAAANWHAIANAAAQRRPGAAGVLVDIGTTTTDVIPFERGKVVAHGATDQQRLCARELLYFGLGRTPICALVDELPYRGTACPVAAEWFATTLDVALLMGFPTPDCPTADGRPAGKAYARERMARTLCLDAGDFTEQDAERAARSVWETMLSRTTRAIELAKRRLASGGCAILVSGAGAVAMSDSLRGLDGVSGVTDLADEMGAAAASCAAAEAVAFLAERGEQG